nr:hypothetical protein [Paraburkholderia phenazinium]
MNFMLRMVALAVCVSTTAHAGRVGVGVYLGPAYPYYYPVAPVPYYYPAYPGYPGAYYYPPAVVMPAAPENYIEQASPTDGGAAVGTWYYCDASRSYYPYVKQCSGGWRSVPAQTPAAQ